MQEGFGNVLATSGSLTTDFWHLTTKQLEPETGLYYFYARWYDPQVGRFITRDLGYRKDYLYCHNNPINLFDPCGTDPIGDLLGEIGKIVAEVKLKIPLVACADAIRKLHQEAFKPRETEKKCIDGKWVDTGVEIVGTGGPCTEYAKGHRHSGSCVGCAGALADVLSACMVPDYNAWKTKAFDYCLTHYP